MAEFDPKELESVYRSNLRALLEAKADGQEITQPVEAEPEAPVIDLMEALRASVEQASKKTKSPAAKATRSRKTAATASRKR